jgi:hypothetical protein
MKKIQFLLFLLMCAISSTLLAQRVTNVDWKLDEVAEKIFITYDLNKESDKLYFDVAMKVIINGKIIMPKGTSVAGEIGKFQRIGKSKKIAWDIREYSDQLEGASIQFQIVASTTGGAGEPTIITDPPPGGRRGLPVYAGLGTAATTGLGLMIGGITSQNNAKEDYDKSLIDINANSASTQGQKTLEINTAFEEFNPKYKKGQALLYGGVGVFALSAGIIVYRIYWNKKLRNDKYGNIYPIFSPKFNGIGTANATQGATIGVGFSKNF